MKQHLDCTGNQSIWVSISRAWREEKELGLLAGSCGFDTVKAENWSGSIFDHQRKLVGDEVGNGKKWLNFRENSL